MTAVLCLPTSFLTDAADRMVVSFQSHSSPKQKNVRSKRASTTGFPPLTYVIAETWIGSALARDGSDLEPGGAPEASYSSPLSC